LYLITLNAHACSVGVLWKTVQTITEISTSEQTTIKMDRLPCRRQD